MKADAEEFNQQEIPSICIWIDSQQYFQLQASPSLILLLYKIFTLHNDVWGYFPKIFEDFPKFFRKPDERFRSFSEDCQRR